MRWVVSWLVDVPRIDCCASGHAHCAVRVCVPLLPALLRVPAPDVLRSHSWSANVAGRKRWWLLPPQLTHLLADAQGQLPADFFAADAGGDGAAAAVASAPGTGRASWGVRPHLLEVQQEPGDVLFVPSGWHHQVHNEGSGSDGSGLTLSINHNWINGHSIHRTWALLALEHAQATRQLHDCR